MEKTLENTELEKYFTTMLEDTKKSRDVIIREHIGTKDILMQLAQGLYFPLLKKEGAQKEQQLEKRTEIVDIYFKAYANYMNSMDDQLKDALGKPVSFNALNRDFNLMIKLMHNNLSKVLDWAIGKEEGIEPEMLEQLSSKLKELTTPPSSIALKK